MVLENVEGHPGFLSKAGTTKWPAMISGTASIAF